MVVDEFIPLSELHNRIYEKFEINCDEFKLNLSFCRKNRESIGPCYVKDDEELEAFLLGRSENTIDTTLHVSTESRGVAEGNVGSNDQSVNHLPEALAYQEEVAEDEEDGEEEEDDEDNVNDACLWHDSFLDRHNLEIEIPDHRVQLVQEPVGFSVVGDEQSMPDIPLAEGVGSIPHDVVTR